MAKTKAAFDPKRISGQATLGPLKNIAAGLGGAFAGHAVGKGLNLAISGVLVLASMTATSPDVSAMLQSAAVGAAVVTPSAGTAGIGYTGGIAGLEGLIQDAGSRSKGYAKSLLTNAGMPKVADAIKGVDGIGYADWEQVKDGLNGDQFDEAYMEGVNDAMMLDGAEDQYLGIEGAGVNLYRTTPGIRLNAASRV